MLKLIYSISFFSAHDSHKQEGVINRYQLIIDEARNLERRLRADGIKMSERAKQLIQDIVQGTINNANGLKHQLDSGIRMQ